MDIIGKRYWFFGFSLLLIVPGLIALSVWGLPLAIDFTGGSKLEVQLPAARALTTSKVSVVLDEFGFGDNIVQLSDDDVVIIRTKDMEDSMRSAIMDRLGETFDSEVVLLDFTSVGPVVGREIASRAVLAVGVAALGILGYITYAFRGVPHAFRYGMGAIFALLHDVAIVLSFATIMGRFFGWEVDALFLTAVLTVIGFSVHDSIVVFDRIRENLGRYRRAPYEEVVNHSVVQTLDRSINTQLTAVFTLFALALFGGTTIRIFVITMLVGMISGTYSSIFTAAPILVLWENREWRNWFRRSTPPATAQ